MPSIITFKKQKAHVSGETMTFSVDLHRCMGFKFLQYKACMSQLLHQIH